VIGLRGMGYPCSSDPRACCFGDMLFRRCVRGMRCNLPSPRPAAVPPPSPPPMSLGIVRGFIGTMQPSDSSSACVPIVRLLPSWAGPECWPDTDEISQVPTKGRHHVHMGSSTARGSSSASHLRGEDVAFSSAERDRHLGIRPVYRGRDGDYSPPPARIRTGPTKTYGSYLEWTTRNRWSGHGCCTRGGGRKRSISRHIRSHVSRCR